MGHHHHHKSRSSKQKQSFVDKLMSCLGMKRRGAQTKKRKQSFDEKNSLAQDVDPSSKDQLVSSPTTTTNLAASDSSKSSTTNMDEGTELTPVDGHGARLCPDGQGGWYYLVPHAALLPPQFEPERGRKTLILDLDETLVHSSFKPVPNADFIVPVRIDTHVHQAYVLKRPGVDAFMKRCGELFEVVVFTASLASYANPVLDLLDRHQVVRTRLFREACVFYRGGYVKDVSRMGRSMEHTTIIDNFAASYCLTPQNGIPILSWFDDPEDRELAHMVPLLEKLAAAPSIYNVLDARGMKAVYSN
jgi:RNA polymerase II subunit A small phosphatase-like protein